MSDAALRHELPQVVVGEAEEGRAERGEDREAVRGVVDRAQDVRERPHLVAGVVLLAADQAERDAPGGEGALVVLDEVRAHAPDEERHVARARRAHAVAVADAPRALPRDLVEERRHGRGDRGHEGADLAVAVLRKPLRGHGEGEGPRAAAVDLVPVRDERPRGGVEVPVREHLVEPLVDEGDDRRDRAEVGGEGEGLAAASLDEALRLLVDRDVGAAEAVDRLLGVADDEELARLQAAAAPVGRGLPLRVLGQEERDLGLQRVGVLELVHQDEVEAPLEVAAHGDRGLQDVARAEEEVLEVHDRRVRLRLLVGGEEAPQPVAQRPGEVRARRRDVGLLRLPHRLQLVLRRPCRRPSASSSPAGPGCRRRASRGRSCSRLAGSRRSARARSLSRSRTER